MCAQSSFSVLHLFKKCCRPSCLPSRTLNGLQKNKTQAVALLYIQLSFFKIDLLRLRVNNVQDRNGKKVFSECGPVLVNSLEFECLNCMGKCYCFNSGREGFNQLSMLYHPGFFRSSFPLLIYFTRFEMLNKYFKYCISEFINKIRLSNPVWMSQLLYNLEVTYAILPSQNAVITNLFFPQWLREIHLISVKFARFFWAVKAIKCSFNVNAAMVGAV